MVGSIHLPVSTKESRNQGHRPALIMNSKKPREPVPALSLEYVNVVPWRMTMNAQKNEIYVAHMVMEMAAME